MRAAIDLQASSVDEVADLGKMLAHVQATPFVARAAPSTRRGHVAGLQRWPHQRAEIMLRGCRGGPINAQGSCCRVAEMALSTRRGHVAGLQRWPHQRAGIIICARMVRPIKGQARIVHGLHQVDICAGLL